MQTGWQPSHLTLLLAVASVATLLRCCSAQAPTPGYDWQTSDGAGSQFWGYSSPIRTANATDKCVQSGGQLAFLATTQDREVLSGALWQSFWVGLRWSSMGSYQWADGSNLENIVWGKQEPRATAAGCAALSAGDRIYTKPANNTDPLFLISADCNTLRRFICNLDKGNATANPWVHGRPIDHPRDASRVLAFASTTHRTWQQAEALCQAAGGHLATINSAELSTALLQQLVPSNKFLVGAQNSDVVNAVLPGNADARMEDGKMVSSALNGLGGSSAPSAEGCTIWDRLQDTFTVERPCPQGVTEVVCSNDMARKDPVEAQLGSKRVLFFSVRGTFAYATMKCSEYNASLLVVESEAENAGLMDLAAVHLRNQPLYLGAYGNNKTIDGRPLPYHNFLRLPAADMGNAAAVWSGDGCVVLSPTAQATGEYWPGAWWPISCLQPRSFVCHKDSTSAAGKAKSEAGKTRIRGAVSKAAKSMGISPQDFVIMLTLLIAGAVLALALLIAYCCCCRAHPPSESPPYGKHADVEAPKPLPTASPRPGGDRGGDPPLDPTDATKSPRDQSQVACVGWPVGNGGGGGCVGVVAARVAAAPQPPRTAERGTSPWNKVLSWMDRHPLPLPPTQRDRTPPPPKGGNDPSPPPQTLALMHSSASGTHSQRPPAYKPPLSTHPQQQQQHLQLTTMPLPTHLTLSPTHGTPISSYPNLHSARLHKSPSCSTSHSHSHSQLGVATAADLLDSHSTAPPRSRRWPSDPQLHEDPPLGPPHPYSHSPPKAGSPASSHSWTSAATPSLEPPSTPNPRTDSRTPPELRTRSRSGFTCHVNSLAIMSDEEWGSPTGQASSSHPGHHASDSWSSDSSDDHGPHSGSHHHQHHHHRDTATPPPLAPFNHAYPLIRSMPWDITPGHTITSASAPLAALSPPSRTGSVHRSSCPTVAPSLHIQTTPPADHHLDTTLPSPSFHITSAQEIIIHTDCKLGQGACGTVFRGEFRSTSVAVKVIDVDQISSFKEAAEQERVLFSYRQEIAVLSRIDHPNILRMYGACMDPPKFLVVEELMHKSLATHIHGAPLGRLPLGEALRVGGAIASGLQHLHPFVVHRDLKPQNVLMSELGHVKIGDFGAARIKLDTYLTESAHMAGTVPYMAPECLRCDSGVSEKCDIYSLGVIIWEAVTGLKPWAGERAVGIIYRVALQGHRLLPPPTCPPAVAELIDRCLDFDPRHRPDAEEVVARVDTLLEHLDTATLAAPVVVIGGPPQTGERSLFPRASLPPPDEISQELLRLQQLPFSRRGSKTYRR